MYYLIDFCRLCLSMKGEFSNMWFDDVMEKVTACISELDFDSNLPLLICNTCMEKIEEFFEFRNQCLQSEFFISGYLEKLLHGVDSKGCTNFISTLLKVDVINDFGITKKYRGNVRLRKKSSDSYPHNKYLKHCLKTGTDNNVTNSNGIHTKEEISHTSQTNTSDCTTKTVEANQQSNVAECRNQTFDDTSNIDDAIFIDDDDDVFIEEEDDYNIPETSSPPENTIEPNVDVENFSERVDLHDQNVSKSLDEIDLHDPENLLVDNGQERTEFDVQTDVSERVKLRKRNAQNKPEYRLDTLYNAPKKDIAKKSTGNKKSHSKKSTSKPAKTEQSQSDKPSEKKHQARKSTTKSWTDMKKPKVKISSGSRELWRAACRNWAMQRMRTSGHVSTGSRNSPNNVRTTDSENRKQIPKSPTTKQGESSNSENVTIETTVECTDSFPDETEPIKESTTNDNDNEVTTDRATVSSKESATSNKYVRPPRVKSVQELNDLLEQQHRRFSENLSSEYGFVLDEDNYPTTPIEAETKANWTAFDELPLDNNELKTPQIVSTFSLSDLMCDEDNINESDVTFELQDNIDIVKNDLSSQRDFSYPTLQDFEVQNINHAAIEEVFLPEPTPDFFSTTILSKNTSPKTYIRLNPRDVLQQMPPKNIQLPDGPTTQGFLETPVTDYDTEIATHYIDSGIPDAPPIAIPYIPKVSVKPLSSLKAPRKPRPRPLKIKTTNNIIFIDSDKQPPTTSGKEEKLYQSNFGNILQHYLKSNTASTNSQRTYCISPLKLVLPRKQPATTESKVKLNHSNPTSSILQNVKKNWADISKGLLTTLPNDNDTPECAPVLLNQLVQPEANGTKLTADECLSETVTLTFENSFQTESTTIKCLQNSISGQKLPRSLPKSSKTNKDNLDDVILIEDSPPHSSSSIIDEELNDANLCFMTNGKTTTCDAIPVTQTSTKVSIEVLDLESDNAKLLDNEVESTESPVFPPQGTKRPSSVNYDSHPAKNARANSEESDDLAIDESSQRSRSPEDGMLVIDDSTPEAESNTHQSEHRLNETLDHTENANQNCTDTKDLFSSLLGSENKNGTNFEKIDTKMPRSGSNVVRSDTPLSKNSESSVDVTHSSSAENRSSHSLKDIESKKFPDIFNAGLFCGIGTRLDQTLTTTANEDRGTAKSSSNTKGSEISQRHEQSRNFKNIIERLESPPQTKHKKILRLRSETRTKPTTSLNNTKADPFAFSETFNPNRLIDCDKKVNNPPQWSDDDSDSSDDTADTSHTLSAPGFNSTLDRSISSDSDSSYVDVEAISDEDEFSESVDLSHLYNGTLENRNRHETLKNKNRNEKIRRTELNRRLKELYDLIDEDHVAERNINSVLTSAKSFIHTLTLKSDKLDSEYHYLKAKHDYLVQTVAQLKKNSI